MNAQQKSKVLVAYFSATGTTEQVAKQVAEAAHADLFEIQPVKPYTPADLDWRNQQSRSSVEMKDPKARPAMKANVPDMSKYDVIYIGFPIWWGVAPRIINTFIEANKLQGKTIILFATSGGSGINEAVQDMKATYPALTIQKGKLLGSNKADIQAFVK